MYTYSRRKRFFSSVCRCIFHSKPFRSSRRFVKCDYVSSELLNYSAINANLKKAVGIVGTPYTLVLTIQTVYSLIFTLPTHHKIEFYAYKRLLKRYYTFYIYTIVPDFYRTIVKKFSRQTVRVGIYRIRSTNHNSIKILKILRKSSHKSSPNIISIRKVSSIKTIFNFH